MRNRFIGPATPQVYIDALLSHWTDKDFRFCCFFMDAASHYFAKHVEMVHDSAVNASYILVGEAIPSY